MGVGICGYGYRYVCCPYPAFQKRGSDKHTQVFVYVCVCCVCAPAFARPKRGSDKHTQGFCVCVCVFNQDINPSQLGFEFQWKTTHTHWVDLGGDGGN